MRMMTMAGKSKKTLLKMIKSLTKSSNNNKSMVSEHFKTSVTPNKKEIIPKLNHQLMLMKSKKSNYHRR
jgi:hypothetical protein